MSKVHGYIEISPDVVINGCKGFLEEREIRAEKKRSDFIKKQMNRRFFPAKTEEQAEKRGFDEFGFCKFRLGGEYWANLVSSIMSQAETAQKLNKLIFISDDVHDCIGKYMFNSPTILTSKE